MHKREEWFVFENKKGLISIRSNVELNKNGDPQAICYFNGTKKGNQLAHAKLIAEAVNSYRGG